jgi:hypothetical protein
MDRSEHPGVPQRPPAYAHLLIDSMDRYARGFPAAGATTTSSDWRLNAQQNVLYGYFTRLAVTQIQFWWNLPTIIAGYNDQFILTAFGTGAGSYAPQIAPGFYNQTELATVLAAAINAVFPGGGFTVVYGDSPAGGFLITAPAGTTFLLTTSANTLVPERCFQTLGLLNQIGGTPPGAATLQGGPPTMIATRFVDIISDYLTKYQRVKDSTTLRSPTLTNVIARIYPTAPNTRIVNDPTTTSVGERPFVICIDYNTPKQIKWSPDEAVVNFDIRVVDEYGQLLPWTPQYGCEYQLTMVASET